MIDEPVVNVGRQAHEREFLRVEEQQVGGEAAEVLHQQRDLEQQLRLGLAARELHGRHRLLHFGEAEPARVASRSSGRPAHAVAGGRAERVLVDAAGTRVEPRGVVAQLGREARRPTAPRSSASPAACGCSRAARCGPRARRDRRARRDAFCAPVARAARRRPADRAQRGQHLVVARAAEMHAAAGCADALRSGASPARSGRPRLRARSATRPRRAPPPSASSPRRMASRSSAASRPCVMRASRRARWRRARRRAPGARRARSPRRRCSAARASSSGAPLSHSRLMRPPLPASRRRPAPGGCRSGPRPGSRPPARIRPACGSARTGRVRT